VLFYVRHQDGKEFLHEGGIVVIVNYDNLVGHGMGAVKRDDFTRNGGLEQGDHRGG
jgi:hypothetical protein